MKTRTRLFLTLTLTFLFAFANSECMRCKASGNNANSALRKAEATGCQQNGKRPYRPLGHVALIDHEIELHETFMMNGKKYHLVFSRDAKYYKEKGMVSAVWLYPDGFKSWKQKDPTVTVYLPSVTEFIVHNVPGQELWGSIIVHEDTYINRKNYSESIDTYTDVRLPDEPAQKILDLIQDNSAYKYYGSPVHIEYNRVQTAALRKTKIEKIKDGKLTTEYTDKRTF